MKQHSQDSNQREKTQTIKSCQPIIQQDLIDSKNKAEKFPRASRSQQNLSESNKWDRLDEKQKIDFIQETNKYLGVKKKAISDIRNIGTEFPIETVYSEEISIDGVSYRSNSLKSKAENIKNNQQGQKQYQNMDRQQKNESQDGLDPQLNILVAGCQDTGKTTFIQCFFNNPRKPSQKYIKQKTKQLTIMSDVGVKYQDEYNINNRLNFVDFPGFKLEGQLSSYINKIWTYALQKSQKFQILKRSNKQKRHKDQRIHCCLYFMQGPRVKQADCKAMKQLGLIFNLIPIIAKADSYTLKQVKEFKENFIQSKIQQELNIYDIKQYLLQQYPDKVKELQNGPFQRAPPFVIAASQQTNKLKGQDKKFVRQYKWGTCEVQNQNHSDFSLLKHLVKHILRKNLIQSTKMVPIQFSLQQQGMKDQQKSNLKCFLASSFALGVTAIVYAGYKFGIFNRNS